MADITIQEIELLTLESLPFAVDYGFRVDSLGSGTSTVRAPYKESFLRPGGTISGPVIMGLADYALFVAILTKIGLVELAVTTNLNINFLRRPEPGDLLAVANVIKIGKRLAVGQVEVYVDGEESMIAHATSTYSIPPKT
tara:strand:+ start:160 stop:579 length:420 start_codon:yes stop_codon:yes gene_type:complete